MTAVRRIREAASRHSVTAPQLTSANVSDKVSDSTVTPRLHAAGSRDALYELVRASRAAQGLPPVVEDAATLSRVAGMFALVDGLAAISLPSDRPTQAA